MVFGQVCCLSRAGKASRLAKLFKTRCYDDDKREQASESQGSIGRDNKAAVVTRGSLAAGGGVGWSRK
jgi:hypothetical protein